MIPFLALGLVGQQVPNPPDQAPTVNGYLIVSSDPAFVKATQGSVPLRKDSYDAFAKRFATPRTRVMPWGKDYAIVFDIESGIFAYYHDRAVLLGALASKLDKDRVLRIQSLSPPERRALENTLVDRPFDPATGEPRVPTALGLQVSTSLTVKKGTVARTVDLASDGEDQRVWDALAQESRDAKERIRQTGTKPPELAPPISPDEIRLTTVTRSHSLAEAMEYTAPVIRDLMRSLKEESERSVALFMKRLGSSDVSLKDEVDRGGLSKEEWKAYGDRFAKNWRPAFKSEAEARAFFEESESLRFSTNVSLVQMFTPTDLAHRRPGTGSVGRIITVPGVFER